MIKRLAWFLLVVLPVPSTAQMSQHPYQPGIDVLHYNFALDLPDTGSVIHGDATILFRRTTAIRTLKLDLFGLQVSAVSLNGATVRFDRDSSTLRISLPPVGHSALPDTMTAEVVYAGPVTDGLIIRTDGDGRWTAFGDNWPNRARHWLPTVDHPSDKATVTWDVTAPANRTIIANGSLERRIPLSFDASARVRTIWSCHRPLPTYVMVIAAAPLVYRNLGVSAVNNSEFPGGVQQALYTFPGQSPGTFGVFDSAISIVNYFSGVFGPFPYEKLAHCQSSTIFGGMENASAIFYYDRGFRTHSITDNLIAHETAHQWFGDAVTPRTWPNLWLSEGFATYCAELWREHSRGDSVFRASMASMRSRVIRSTLTARRPVLDTAETNLLALLNSNSYQKGAWILHMLRSLLGDDAFFHSLRSYYADFRHATAVSEDLRNECERISGKDLGWFFDQWLRRPGYIDGQLTWKVRRNQGVLELTMLQGATFPPYRFPLTLGLNHRDGTTERRSIEVRAVHETTVEIPWKDVHPPERIIADPDVTLLGNIAVVE